MIESLGNIGDFIGGFGVVVTVIYLAYQIRQNTASTRSATYQSVVADVSEWTLQLGLNPESARIYVTGIEDLDDLTSAEVAQFNFLLASVIRHFENIHYQYLSGAIDHDVWDGWSSRILGVLGKPGVKAWWDSQKAVFSNDFQAFIDEAPASASRTYQFFTDSQADPE